YLGMSPDRLYKLRTFSQTFSEEQIKHWAERRMTEGGRIRYHHLAAIMVVKLAAERLRLIELVFAQSLSVRNLRDVIASGAKDEGRAGTVASRPKSLAESLGQLIDRSRTLVKKFASWDKGLFRELERLKADSVDPLLRVRVIS